MLNFFLGSTLCLVKLILIAKKAKIEDEVIKIAYTSVQSDH